MTTTDPVNAYNNELHRNAIDEARRVMHERTGSDTISLKLHNALQELGSAKLAQLKRDAPASRATQKISKEAALNIVKAVNRYGKTHGDRETIRQVVAAYNNSINQQLGISAKEEIAV